MHSVYPTPVIHARILGILTRRHGHEWLVLPAPGARWRLPGNPIRRGELPSDTAWRTVHEQSGIRAITEPRLESHFWGAPSTTGAPTIVTYVFTFTALTPSSAPAGDWVTRREATRRLDPSDLHYVADLTDPRRRSAPGYLEYLP